MMAVGIRLASIFLVFWLSEVDYCTAFPRARRYGFTDTRQGEFQKPQQQYGYGNRRPLQYIQALRQRQGQRGMQAKAQDQAQVMTQQKPQGNPIRVYTQIQSQPSLYSQNQSQYRDKPDVATKRPWERTPPRTSAQLIQYRQKQAPQAALQHHSELGPSHTNHPQFKPRGFEFSIKFPFANVPAQNQVIGGATKGFDPVSGGSDGSGNSQSTYRPTSVEIHSSFNRPSSSDGLSQKESTNDPNGAKNAHDVSKPRFQLSLSIPIQSTKPSGSNVGFSNAGGVQNSYIAPEEAESNSTQSGSFSNLGSAVQKETEHRANGSVQTKPTKRHPTNFPTEQTSQRKIPTKQKTQDKLPPPYLQRYENAPSGYYSSYIKPTSMDYGKGQSGHYNVQLKPIGNNYDGGQIQQSTVLVTVPPTNVPEQYNYGQFKPSFDQGQNEESLPHPISQVSPSSPTFAPSQYEPSFGKTDFTKPIVASSYSFSPYQYSKGQSGHNLLPDPLIAVDRLSHFQEVPSKRHQTQPSYASKGQLNGKFTRLVIDADYETNINSPLQGAVGQHDSSAAPTTPYGYSDKWPGQKKPTVKPGPVSAGFREPSSPGVYGQGHNVLNILHTYIEEQLPSEPTSDPVPDSFSPQYEGEYEYPNGYLQQHTSNHFGQTTEANYPSSVNLMSHSNAYGLNENNQYSYGNQYSGQVAQHGNPLGTPAPTEQHIALQQMAYLDPAPAVVSRRYPYNPLNVYDNVFQLDPSNFNSPQTPNGLKPISVDVPEFTKYLPSVPGTITQEPAFELSIAIPSVYQHNQVSSSINPRPQAPQYTLLTRPSSLQLTQQQLQRVSEVKPPHSAQPTYQHSTSTNGYFAQAGRRNNPKPFVSGYPEVHPKPSSQQPANQHSQRTANAAKPLQSFQPIYQEGTSYNGGFAQVRRPVNPKPQTSHSPTSNRYGGGYRPHSVHSGYMPSSNSREPMRQSTHMSFSGEHSGRHRGVASGGYKPNSSPRQPMAQDVYNTGYKPSSNPEEPLRYSAKEIATDELQSFVG